MSPVSKIPPIARFACLAIVFGALPLVAERLGLLPPHSSQIGAFSASAAGIFMAAATGGRAGGVALLRRALIWRVGWRWWAFALFFPVLPSVAALMLFDLLGGPDPDWSALAPLPTVVPMIVVLTLLAGFGEEFGWRGFATPHLQRRYSALTTSLVVGLIWGLWHIPLFVTDGTVQSAWRMDAGWVLAVGGYTVFCIAWSIQYTWVLNNTRGSVLLAAVMHGAGNAWFGGYIGVYRGHFAGILCFTLVMSAASAAIVVMTRGRLGRGAHGAAL